MFGVLVSQFVNGLLDFFKSTFFSHGLGGNVGVHTGTVPVSFNNWLGVKCAVDLEIFTDTLQDVSGHCKLVTSINSDAWSDLVFLLSRHDLSVGSRDFDSGVKGGFVHGLDNGTSKGVLWTDRAVVRTLFTAGHATLGPAKRGALIQVEEGEFLFHSEPDFFLILAFKGLLGNGTVVGFQSLSSRSVGIAHDKDVVNSVRARAEGVLEDTARTKDDRSG
mmetsp:Transcript_38804/g.93803  ORF Transcript_38804/g.93803 Transcript_38804/m.93803 type:complete len:219 (+) Transcript_38804:346-1002(+)